MERMKLWPHGLYDEKEEKVVAYKDMVISSLTTYGNGGYSKHIGVGITIKYLNCRFYKQLLFTSMHAKIEYCTLMIDGKSNRKNISNFLAAQKLAKEKNIQLCITFGGGFFPDEKFFQEPKIWYNTNDLGQEKIEIIMKNSKYLKFPTNVEVYHPVLTKLLCSDEYIDKFSGLDIQSNLSSNQDIYIKNILAHQNKLEIFKYESYNHDNVIEVINCISGIEKVSIKTNGNPHTKININNLLEDEKITSIELNFPFCFDNDVMDRNFRLVSFNAYGFYIQKSDEVIKESLDIISKKVKENYELSINSRFLRTKVAPLE